MVIVFAALLLVVVLLVLRHARTAFVIELDDGSARCVSGTPPAGFVSACEDVARLYRVDRGRIRGVRTGAGLQLRFSRDIPERVRQPFRNVWTPPPGGGPGGHRARG